MKQTFWTILIVGGLAILFLDGYMDVPVEQIRTHLWTDVHMTSAGTDGKLFRDWLEERGYRPAYTDMAVVQGRLGHSAFPQRPGQKYWQCTIVKERPLGDMTYVIYCVENANGTYLDHKTKASVEGWP